jgi:hypothetical protein
MKEVYVMTEQELNQYEVRILVAGNMLIETVAATAYKWRTLDVVFYVGTSEQASYNVAQVVSVTRVTENKNST